MERNHSIDVLKLICALLVVFIHCEYPYKSELLPITDVAVPLFFCISGYFVFGTKTYPKHIVRIVGIFAWSALLYLTKTEVFHLLTTNQLWIPSLKAICNFIFFNDVAFSIHLWYLPAYLYVLVIASLIDKYNLWKYSFCSIIPLLFIGVLIKYFIADVCPEEVEYYRNAYFNGLPYFLVGALMKKYHLWYTFKYKREWLLVIVVIFFMLRYVLDGSELICLVFLEIDLLLLTYCIFMLTAMASVSENCLSLLGCRYSLYIYIFHVMIMSICEMSVCLLPPDICTVYMFLNPLCVFVLSIVLAYMLGKFKIIKI